MTTNLPDHVEAYLTRSDWGANPLEAKAVALPTGQFAGFVLHHTVFVLTDYDRDGFLRGDLDDVARYMRVLQVARPDLGSEVPYSWVIFAGTSDDTCVIAEGRGRGRKGAHTAGLNSSRYAWAIAGNTDADQPVTPGMVAGMRWLAATVLDDPEHAVGAIGHRHAPPYIDAQGHNLNATGCPGDQGVSMLGQLQPPYRIDQPQPLRRDTAMFTITNAQAVPITFRVDGDRLVHSWRVGGKRSTWQEVIPGTKVKSLGQPSVAGEAIFVPIVAATEFGDLLLTLVQSRLGGTWEAKGTDELADALAALAKR